MKRAWSIMLSVLLGAAMVGIGTGYFLHLANRDRQLLALEVEGAKANALRAQQEQQSAVQEANRKLKEASDEVGKAQDVIKELQFERSLMAQAKLLTLPPSSLIQDWKMAVSTGQDVALRYPPGSSITQNDELMLSLALDNNSQNAPQDMDGPWLTIQPYNQTAMDRLQARLASSTSATYLVDGQLLHGYKGLLPSGGQSYAQAAVLAVYQHNTTTRLIWIQDAGKAQTSRKIHFVMLDDILATFSFPTQPQP